MRLSFFPTFSISLLLVSIAFLVVIICAVAVMTFRDIFRARICIEE